MKRTEKERLVAELKEKLSGAKALYYTDFSGLNVKRMTDLGYNIIPGTPEQMTRMLKEEVARWAPIVKASGAKVD